MKLNARRVDSAKPNEKNFGYAIVIDRAEYTPAEELASAMSRLESEYYPCLSVEKLPNFFKALPGYTGSPLAVLASFADPYGSSRWRTPYRFLERVLT